MGWWVYDLYQTDPVLLVSWVVWVICSITLHELGHGWAAIRLGDRTPIELGRMTPNPLVHMGGLSLLIFAIVGIAWGMMPVNPNRLRGRYAASKVALAGPAVNLLLATACIILAAVWLAISTGAWSSATTIDGPIRENLLTFLRAGAFLNLVLLGFNLVPAPPLDGARVCADVFPSYRRMFFESQQGALLGLGVLMLIFWFGGGFIFPAAVSTADFCISMIAMVITGGRTP